jgi:hypothetical protein
MSDNPVTAEQPQAAAKPAGHRNGLGIAALVCGIVGSVVGLIPILGIPALACGLTGFGLGLGALRRLRHRWADNKVMTWFGVVLSVLAVVLGIVGIVIVFKATNNLNSQLNSQ